MKNLDLVLRLLYCTVAPIVLAAFATQVPVGAIALGAVVATVLSITEGHRWREAVGRVPVIGAVFRGPGKLNAYYREHPPKPLVYYIFYPVLLPYVMFKKPLRAEWRLYRKTSAIALVVLVVTALVDYVRHWQPELSFGFFFVNFIVIFIFQMLLTMIVIMPLVTTILLAHGRARRAWIRGLAVIVVLGTVVGAAVVIRNKTPSSILDRRVFFRAAAVPKRALEALRAAATAAAMALPPDAPEGMVTGAPLEAARRELRKLWKADEAGTFRVWTSPNPRIVLVLEVGKKHPPVAFAVDAKGRVVQPGALPPAAAELLKKTKLP